MQVACPPPKSRVHRRFVLSDMDCESPLCTAECRAVTRNYNDSMKLGTYLYGYLVPRNGLSHRRRAPTIRSARGCALMHTFHLHAHARRVPEIENQLRLVRRVRLLVEVAKVTPNRRRRNPERMSNAQVLQAAATKRKNIALATRKLDAARQCRNGQISKRRK